MDLVTDKESIVSIISRGIKNHKDICLSLDSRILHYYSSFKTGETEGDFLYLHIAALKPSIGNVKIRNSFTINLSFQDQENVIETQVYFLRVISQDILRLSFPKKLMIMKQKRASVRVIPPDDMEVVLLLKRSDSGDSFSEEKLVDISFSGMLFESAISKTTLQDKEYIEYIISRKNCEYKAEGHAVIISSTKRKGTFRYRAEFMFETSMCAEEIEKLVAEIQHCIMQRRVHVLSDIRVMEWELPSKGNVLHKHAISTSNREDIRDKIYALFFNITETIKWIGISFAVISGGLIALDISRPWNFLMLTMASISMGTAYFVQNRSEYMIQIGLLFFFGLLGFLRYWF